MTSKVAPSSEELLRAMEEELSRSMQGLRIPGSPRPYHLLYALRRRRSLVLQASHGSLLKGRELTASKIYAETRVGNRRFDNIYDAGLDIEAEERESADWQDAPDDLDLEALKLAFWKLTQLKFDEAQADYYDHRKALISEYLRDETDSFTREPKVVHIEGISEEAFPRDRWEGTLIELSRRFLEHPDVYDPSLSLRMERVQRWQVSSEGARIVTENLFVEFAAEGWVLTEDGVYVEASRSVYGRSLDDIPDREGMSKLLDEILAELAELREAESPGAFIGPALLAGQAASTMFHEALGHRLEGGRLVARGETRTFANKIGHKVLPEGLHVFDDPTMDHFGGVPLWGGYRIDDEGVRSQRADLVVDGELVGFLRNRTGIPGSEHSSGHGRHDGVQPTMARMGNFVVEADERKAQSWDVLKAKLIELAREQGRKEAAIIIRIRSGETSTNSYDFQVFKGELAEIYLVNVDSGELRRVRDLELIGTPLTVMQRIEGFGGEPGVDHGFCFAESGSLPVSGVAPAILLAEVELQQRSSSGFHEPLLPPPFADDGSRGRTGRLRKRGRRKR